MHHLTHERSRNLVQFALVVNMSIDFLHKVTCFRRQRFFGGLFQVSGRALEGGPWPYVFNGLCVPGGLNSCYHLLLYQSLCYTARAPFPCIVSMRQPQNKNKRPPWCLNPSGLPGMFFLIAFPGIITISLYPMI